MTNKAQAKESAVLRNQRIEGTNNGSTLPTRVVKDKKKYNRNLKHKKSFALAEDFPFIKGKLWEKQVEIARWGFFSDEKGVRFRTKMSYYTEINWEKSRGPENFCE